MVTDGDSSEAYRALLNSCVKAVFIDQEREKVIRGTLIAIDDMSVTIKDDTGNIVIVGKSKLVFLRTEGLNGRNAAKSEAEKCEPSK